MVRGVDLRSSQRLNAPIPRMRILIAYPEAGRWRLPAGCQMTTCGTDAPELTARLTDATTVLVTDAMPDPEAGARDLRWIHLLSAGYNQAIDHPLTERSGLRVTNSAGLCAGHMAEFIVGQMLRQVKRFDELAALQQARTWPHRVSLAAPALRGRRALIVGYGGVGRETARLLTALGVAVDAVQRTAERTGYHGFLPATGMGDPEGRLPERVYATQDLAKALPDADFVILTIPLTPRTRHLLNQRTLGACKSGAVIINVARGDLIELPSLIRSLEQNRIGHAYLDVFSTEPLPADSPLWRQPRVTVTPHMSGVMPDAARLHEQLLRENLRRFQAGEPMLNEIDPERLKA